MKVSEEDAREYHHTYYLANRREFRDRGLTNKYGISVDEYQAMLEAQGAVKELAVDHDHPTDRVRGLLCDRCNKGVGFFGDDPQRLCDAAQYLTPGLGAGNG